MKDKDKEKRKMLNPETAKALLICFKMEDILG